MRGYARGVSDVVTYGIELGVGLASCALARPSWQRGGSFRVVGVILAVAGIAAVAHAVLRLV